jgi:predicted nucleotide-binding protein
MPTPAGPPGDRVQWTFTITRDVRRFKEVSSIEAFLEAVPPESAGSISTAEAFERTFERLGLHELAVSSAAEMTAEPDPHVVMVVYGRNTAARNAMFSFLRALGLHPIEWEEAIAATGQGSPHNLEAVQAAMRLAQAVIVLLTAEDQAGLMPALAGASDAEDIVLRGQPRQNVILEAGMAMGVARDRTILVELGPIRAASDFDGLNTVRMSNESRTRDALRSRLQAAGCALKLGSDWLDPLSAGDFDAAAIEWSPVEDWHVMPPPALTTTAEELEDRQARAPKGRGAPEPRLAQEQARIENIIERVLDRHAGIDQPLEPETFLVAIDNPKLDVVWAKRMLVELEAAGRVYRNPDGPGWYPATKA